MRVAVYYLGDTTRGVRLYREFRTVPRSAEVIRAAVDAMLHVAPADADYRSLWPTATRVLGVSVSGTTATVDLSREAQGGSSGAEGERFSVQQLVHTVTAAAPAVRSVRLHVEGRTVPTLWGHVDTSGPRSRDPQVDALAPVWITDPAEGTSTGHTFTVRGSASVFEATVSWSVTTDCGAATCPELKTGFDTATTGAPGRGDWSATVTLPASVTGRVVVRAWESSAEDGRVTFLDTKTVRVT